MVDQVQGTTVIYKHKVIIFEVGLMILNVTHYCFPEISANKKGYCHDDNMTKLSLRTVNSNYK